MKMYGSTKKSKKNPGIQEKKMEMQSLKAADAVLGDEESMTRQIISNPTMREKEREKFEKLIGAAASKAPGPVVNILKKITPCLSWTAVCCEATIPIYMRVFGIIAKFVSMLPQDELAILCGLLLCFFGGMYPMTMAAAEAWRQCGGDQTAECIHDLYAQFQTALEASKADDELDEDGDGIADVEQISGNDLATRKARIVLVSTDPVIVNKAFKGVYSGWAAIIAVLKLEFAKTIALGSAIGDFLNKWATIPMTKILVHFMAEDLQKWIPTIISYTCKIVAITIAYKIQQIISTFYSAIRGGLMVTRNGLNWLSKKGLLNIDPETTYIDEVLGWCLAALGFYMQFKSGFAAPWFIQLILWPLGAIEGALIWSVASPTPST